MWTRVEETWEKLSPGEKSSLRQLNNGPRRPRIPLRHAERLLSLGLAELSLGRLEPTVPGRQLLGR